MHITLLYAWEKLHLAVRALATLPAPLKERLSLAYINNLSVLEPEDVPEPIKAKFVALHDKITEVDPKGDEGSIRASVNSMSDEEASDLADDIVSMYDAITRADAIAGPGS